MSGSSARPFSSYTAVQPRLPQSSSSSSIYNNPTNSIGIEIGQYAPVLLAKAFHTFPANRVWTRRRNKLTRFFKEISPPSECVFWGSADAAALSAGYCFLDILTARSMQPNIAYINSLRCCLMHSDLPIAFTGIMAKPAAAPGSSPIAPPFFQ